MNQRFNCKSENIKSIRRNLGEMFYNLDVEKKPI